MLLGKHRNAVGRGYLLCGGKYLRGPSQVRRNPASAPENGIVDIIEGQNARGRLAESEEARQYVSEACKSPRLLLPILVLTQARHRAKFFN